MTLSLRVEAAGRTHMGFVRRRNEDAIYLGRSLVAVADGLGGHVAGDVASSTVIEALRRYDQEVEPARWPPHSGGRSAPPTTPCVSGSRLSRSWRAWARRLVAMLCSGTTAALANVGDSRAYLLRDPAPTPTGPRESFRSPKITSTGDWSPTPATCRTCQNAWPVSSTAGPTADPPTSPSRELRPGDRFLLCSDGLELGRSR